MQIDKMLGYDFGWEKLEGVQYFDLSYFFGMLRRGFTDDDLFNSSFDSQLPEPHIVALLHKALLYLVPYLQMSPELILEKFHRLLHSSNFDNI